MEKNIEYVLDKPAKSFRPPVDPSPEEIKCTYKQHLPSEYIHTHIFHHNLKQTKKQVNTPHPCAYQIDA